MKTLTIKDLARTEQLDRTAMAAVHGGHKASMSSYSYDSPTYSPKYDSSIKVSQELTQVQDVLNATANGSAFLDNIFVDNHTDQFGQNNVSVRR